MTDKPITIERIQRRLPGFTTAWHLLEAIRVGRTAINRVEWQRGGQPAVNSSLLTSLNTMCCLGFDCLQHHNVARHEIKTATMPYAVLEHHWTINETTGHGTSSTANKLGELVAALNDNPSISEQTREHLLSLAFKVGEQKAPFFYGQRRATI